MDSSKENSSSLEFDDEVWEVFVRGVEIYYSMICPTKLWFFMKNINMEHTSPLVIIGKILHETYFKRRVKNVLIDNQISIDFLTYRDTIVVHEVKKSSAALDASKLQIQYYILQLLRRGAKKVYGVIHIPREKRKIRVYLDKEGFRLLKQQIQFIEEIRSRETPPPPKKNRFCRRCSYNSLCWVE